jgi:dolichyl-phosphate-mannose-protein mannosyltransferase
MRNWRLLAILVLAAAVRLAWIALVPNTQYSDSVWYDGAAANLAANGVYGPDGPSAWFPPGYPFLLTAIYKFVGHSEIAGKLANVVIGVGLTAFTYLLGRRVAGEAVGLVAGLLIAIWPNLIFHTGILSSDLLAAFGFVAAMWLGMRQSRGSHPLGWPAWVLGVLIGWMVLVRPVSLILLAALGLWWWLEAQARREPLGPTTPAAAPSLLGGRHAGVTQTAQGESVTRSALRARFLQSTGYAVTRLAPLVLCVGVIVGAWTVRNYLQFGEVITIATNGGYNFWQTNQPYADGNDTYWPFVPMDDPEYQTMRNADEFTKNREGYRYAIAYLEAHPEHLLKMLPAKLFWLYHTDTSGFYEGAFYPPMEGPSVVATWIDSHERLMESMTFRYYEVVMVLGVIGVLLALVIRGGASLWVWPLFSLPLLLTFFHVFFHAKDRFHIPLDGIVAIFAAVAIVEAVRYSAAWWSARGATLRRAQAESAWPASGVRDA